MNTGGVGDRGNAQGLSGPPGVPIGAGQGFQQLVQFLATIAQQLPAAQHLPADTGESSPPEPSSVSSNAPTVSPDQVMAMLSRPGYGLDPTRVSTGSFAPGETGGTTSGQLVVDRALPNLARAGITHEVARQMLARDESERRAASASSELGRLGQGQKSLTAARSQGAIGTKHGHDGGGDYVDGARATTSLASVLTEAGREHT
ncbi:MAG: hypothetical protein HY319_20040, partial [Armatimonadetes bacterium]|nr:hypothetical protein [Armatimonadota bacterium]